MDILWDELSVNEHLRLYMNLRGCYDELDVSICNKVELMIKYGDKKVRELSGGMKRMLSMVITGMHSPSIVLLDEPTSGMDIVSRR